MTNHQSNLKKVVIIGGGIIGLYLAWRLSEMGQRVTLFEKKGKIGKEACSGLFSERIFKFIPESRKLIQNQINSVLIHFPKKTVKVKFSKPFFAMNHAELDRLVADLAQKAGAVIVLNKTIDTLPQGFDRIIGCDGADSFVRKELDLKDTKCRLGILGFIGKEDFSDFVETWPVDSGFLWRIPRGRQTEYGVIAQPVSVSKVLADFLKKNDVKIEQMKSALIPQGFGLPKNEKITLCGDAAGLTKAWSGGGVIWGLTAADILLKNFPDFIKYRKRAKRVFSARIILAKLATRTVYFLGFKIPRLLPGNVKIESDFLL